MDCYLNGREPLYDARLALEALRLILAFYRSSEPVRAVALDEII